MKERPILFSAPMVRALLAGTKTQTRRLATHRHGIAFLGGRGDENDPECWGYAFDGPEHHGYAVLARGKNERHNHGLVSIPCPYGVPGDRLWVRETWRCVEREEDGVDGVRYAADDAFLPIKNSRASADDWIAAYDNGRHGENWRPSIFLPRWASRITLEVTEVRVQRLQEITEEDARAEGVTPVPFCRAGTPPGNEHRDGFAELWDHINGDTAPWSASPWVWAISFKRCP